MERRDFLADVTRAAALCAIVPGAWRVTQQNRRGYISCAVDDNSFTANYRTVQFVSKPGAPIDTPTSWRVTRGKPGIERLA